MADISSKNFNPRSRTGSDSGTIRTKAGETLFQSTLPHGERRDRCKFHLCHKNFNPRSRTGSDVKAVISNKRMLMISIHAPARGATIQTEHGAALVGISIHAPARGATVTSGSSTNCVNVFQSTLPHGERRSLTHFAGCQRVFQSTLPHGERRDRPTNPCLRQNISIHAPARGATWPHIYQRAPFLFQSTLPHGERPRAASESATLSQFQSTLPHGERLRCGCCRFFHFVFQSTLPHGERLFPGPSLLPGSHFNPRSRTGSDSSSIWS